jgi:catechol 2,3-dioxygenase-like lactoylglutathione lyase family enzyme
MFDHVTMRASDLDASRRFYEPTLAILGFEAPYDGGHFLEWDDFSVDQARADRPVTRGLHVAFVSSSRAHVDEFWRAGTAAGYTSDGEPGPRPEYHADYYGAFLLDPDGNSAEAVHHGRVRKGIGVVDHIWIGAGDLHASKRFYTTIAAVVGVRIAGERPERFHVVGGDRSFALVHDGRSPTENVHLAFPAPDNATVDDFHRVALGAGYRDNGAPGERRYHPGYYSAFVLDPDGNNIEAVCHNRD